MKKILSEYTGKQILAEILRALLSVIYIGMFISSLWLCRNFTPGYIFDRIVPYGIPPLLTLLCAAFLSIFVLTLEQSRTETLLFSIICFVFTGLNLDIFLLGIITDPKLALIISRMDHFMLALIQMGANLHLVYLVCEKKNNWWIVWTAYAVGAIIALFTPTDLYFQGIRTYYWGLFAQKAILYDVMSTLWLTGTLYGISILFFSYRNTDNPHKKETIKFILMGFISTVVLSLTNTPAMYGYEIYPLGTFTFISLILLAYGLFKYNLRIALQQLRTLVLITGHLCFIAGIAFTFLSFLPKNALHLKLLIGILLVTVLYQPVLKIWNAFLNLFLKQSAALLQDELYALTFRLSEIHHLKKLHREICDWLFKNCMNSQCTMVFFDKNQHCYTGWQSLNPHPVSGLFHHPIKLLSDDTPIRINADHSILKKTISTRAQLVSHPMINRWMTDLRLAGHPKDLLLQAGIIIPIFSQSRMISFIMIGNKLNDRLYSRAEKEIFKDIGIVLAPFVENARLLEALEQRVKARTQDLNNAMETLKRQNHKISENNAIIKQQNHIFLSLFETSTHIHDIEELHVLFADTLNQLRALFPHLGFGIIHEGERSEILESGAFIGISEKAQSIILENRQHLTQENIKQILNANLTAESTSSPEYWMIQPMQIRDNRVIGKIIIKGPRPDQITHKVISIFLAQVAAAAHNKFLMRKLETTANTDGLTGVGNRAFFDREFKKTLHNAALFSGIHFSILMIDINGLKRINDNFGHDKGDHMIQRVADLLSSICRETDVLARIGGDEFIILLPATDSAQAKVLIHRIRQKEKKLSLSCRRENDETLVLPIRFSIGMAGSDETFPENVMKLADQRMYTDKEIFYQNPVKNS